MPVSEGSNSGRLAGGVDVLAGEAGVVAAERQALVAQQLLAEADGGDAQVAGQDVAGRAGRCSRRASAATACALGVGQILPLGQRQGVGASREVAHLGEEARAGRLGGSASLWW